ncbi:hypothetical protein RB195_024314 [Necator americanus]|uniref:Uncharacterized protein n=1 Tax=Necator americanus TaxID=51031 RepID=A0ABR1EMR4_NECAM
MRSCGPTPALTIFAVAYAPTSSYEKEEVEALYMDIEKRTPGGLHIGTHGLQWSEQGEKLSELIMTTKTIHGNSQIQKPSSLRWTWESPDGGYHNEIDHRHRHRERGAARAAGNQEFTSKLTKLAREAIKEDLKERRAEVLAEAAEVEQSIPYAPSELRQS